MPKTRSSVGAALGWVALAWALAGGGRAPASQDFPPERLRQALGDWALVGDWIYDDLAAGLARAKKTGQPLLVVLRCVT